jgi:hypothetical protein
MPTTSSFVGPSKSRFQSSLQSYDLFVSGDTPKKNESVRLEFDHYIDDEVLPRTENFDILTWWKSNGIKYPTLQKIARDILAIPVTTVASESAFSTSGRLLSPHRSRLHPKTIEALMCAQSWLWTEIKGDFFFFFLSHEFKIKMYFLHVKYLIMFIYLLFFLVVGSSPMPKDCTIQSILDDVEDPKEEESGVKCD